MTLTLTTNIDQTDEAYAALLAAHEGLTKEESDALNARLILVMMNQIGDIGTIRAAIEAAQAR